MLNFDQLYVSSFKERLDHLITNKLQAYTNVSAPLFANTTDDRLSSYKIASSRNKQWVYDSSVSGATIASSSGLSGGWQNAKVDFRNGRIVAPGNVTTPVPTSINVAEKYFNVYVSSDPDEELVLKLDFLNKENDSQTQTKAITGDTFYGPCIFVKPGRTKNVGHEIGGKDRTYFDFKVSVFARSEAELLAVGGVIRDMNQTATFLLDSTPLNEFHDLKDRPWSFSDEMGAMRALGQPKIFIEDCYFNPIKSDALNTKLPNIHIGLGTFRTFVVRSPRQ